VLFLGPRGRADPDSPDVRRFSLPLMFEKCHPFEIREERTGASALTMRLYGEFDLACSERFETALERVSRDGLRELVIDLAGLTFVDSSGIRSLLRAKSQADQDGLVLFVTLPPFGQVRKTFDLTGLGRMISRTERL